MRINKYRLELVKEEGVSYDIESKSIKSPPDAYDMLNLTLKLDSQAEEVFSMLCLNKKNDIIGCFEIARGALSAALVHPREVFKRAILCNAASIIVAHNHPSGDSRPSKEDDAITRRLSEAGDIIGISVTDHIIVGDEKYYSYKEMNPSLMESHRNIGGNYA